MQLAKTMQKAIEAAEAGNAADALKYFEELFINYPNDKEAQYNAGIYFSSIGEHLKACEALFKAHELDKENVTFLQRTAIECLQIAGAGLIESDFMAYDISYLVKAKTLLEDFLKAKQSKEISDLLERIDNHSQKNRIAFRFLEGDLDYCRQALARKKEMSRLEERVMGFLNLLDSGEYFFEKGKFSVSLKSDLPKENKQGFLERIRNMVLGK